jgi:hypothetical protein
MSDSFTLELKIDEEVVIECDGDSPWIESCFSAVHRLDWLGFLKEDTVNAGIITLDHKFDFNLPSEVWSEILRGSKTCATS